MDNRAAETDSIESLLGESVPTLDSKSGSGEYYLPSSHIQLLEQIEHLSRYSHFIQVITGVTGIGKTTLLQQFYPSADDNAVHACCIQALPEMNAAALLAELVLQLNLNTLEPSSEPSLLQAVLDHAELLKQLSRQMLIVIDDAEQLSQDALELLFNQLSTLPDDEIRPHIVLFATPQIKQTTEAASLSEVVESSCHFIDIQPLDSDELNGLLDHCFSAIASRLDETQKQRILTDSLGLPGRVPRILEAIATGRQDAATEPATPTKRSTRPLVWALAASAILVLFGAGLWFALPGLLEQQQQSPLAADETGRVRLELSLEPKINQAQASSESPTAVIQATGFEQRLAQARAALEAEQQPKKPQPNAAANENTIATSPAAPATSQQLQLATIKDAPPASVAISSNIATVSEQQPAKLVLKLPATAEIKPTTATNIEQFESAPSAPSRSYFGDGQTLLSWDSSGYTLQMLGARREKSVIQFIASMPNKEQLLHFSTIYKEKPWYVVLYGSYPSRAAAMTAMGDLPPKLRSRRPWARSIKGVQDDIRRGDK
ncbi:MAG: AAA family ATPase [Halopseudomonas sp.]